MCNMSTNLLVCYICVTVKKSVDTELRTCVKRRVSQRFVKDIHVSVFLEEIETIRGRHIENGQGTLTDRPIMSQHVLRRVCSITRPIAY